MFPETMVIVALTAAICCLIILACMLYSAYAREVRWSGRLMRELDRTRELYKSELEEVMWYHRVVQEFVRHGYSRSLHNRAVGHKLVREALKKK